MAIELKSTGELIGDVGLNEVEGEEDIEIGYVISEKYTGNGYATELVAAMETLAKERFGASVLYGRVLHGNHASVRVLEKNGYLYNKLF